MSGEKITMSSEQRTPVRDLAVVVAEDVEAVNGKVSIGEGSTVGAEVETVNGGIELLGVRVGGNVETVNGDMFIGANTVVKGKLVVHEPKGSWFSSNSRKPKVVIEAGAVVEGGFDFRREVELVRDPAAKIGPQSTNVER